MAHKTIILMGPSYVGKSTVAASLSEANQKIFIAQHEQYRNTIKFGPLIKVFLFFLFIYRWREILIPLLNTNILTNRSLAHRTIRYGFITFLLLRKYDHKINCLLDEDFIKKLIDSIPIPRNYSEYMAEKNKFIKIVHGMTAPYLKIIDHNNKIIVIADCPYRIAKPRAKKRSLNDGYVFNERNFRNRYTLERAIYRQLSKSLKESKINYIIINTAIPSHKLAKIISTL